MDFWSSAGVTQVRQPVRHMDVRVLVGRLSLEAIRVGELRHRESAILMSYSEKELILLSECDIAYRIIVEY